VSSPEPGICFGIEGIECNGEGSQLPLEDRERACEIPRHVWAQFVPQTLSFEPAYLYLNPSFFLIGHP
jgi:hypothetical protein